MRLQPLDLGLGELGGHGQLADLRLQAPDLGIPRIRRPALERGLAAGEERVAPAARRGGRPPEPARDRLQALPPQQPQHRVLLAPRRHPPPRRGPVSASVGGALRRAPPHPPLLPPPPPPPPPPPSFSPTPPLLAVP